MQELRVRRDEVQEEQNMVVVFPAQHGSQAAFQKGRKRELKSLQDKLSASESLCSRMHVEIDQVKKLLDDRKATKHTKPLFAVVQTSTQEGHETHEAAMREMQEAAWAGKCYKASVGEISGETDYARVNRWFTPFRDFIVDFDGTPMRRVKQRASGDAGEGEGVESGPVVTGQSVAEFFAGDRELLDGDAVSPNSRDAPYDDDDTHFLTLDNSNWAL